MASDPQPTAPIPTRDLGHSLEPHLIEACKGRLSDVRWFQSDWQRGGAATAFANYQLDDAGDAFAEVVVKFPVGPVEHRVTVGLSDSPAPTPVVAAHGTELGGYDLAWLVMERVPGDPIAKDAKKPDIKSLLHAAAAFSLHAETLGAAPSRRHTTDWESLLDRARQAIRDNEIPDHGRWKAAVRHTQKALSRLLLDWNARRVSDWCHGDLHLGNALRRPEGSVWGAPGCILIDLAGAHAGHWTEDAVYFERLHWAHPESLHGARPVKLLAKARRDLDLPMDDDHARLASIRRVLIAACVPAFLEREGHPAYLAAALDTLEKSLSLLSL